MIRSALFTLFILSSFVLFAQRGIDVKGEVPTTGTVFNPSPPSWSHGIIDIVESFNDKIQVRWKGPKTQNCATSDDVAFTVQSLGSQEAFDRAFKLAMTAAVSGKPIRFRLDGCIGNLQKANLVQLCANDDCSF